MFSVVLAPGTYQYKAVNTGSWDAIGSDFRDVNANNAQFTVTAADPRATMWVNALNGTIKVNVGPVPEPSSIAALALGAGIILRRRRK